MLKADANGATKRYVIGELDKVLSLDLLTAGEVQDNGVDDSLTAEVEALIAKRAEARAAKDWATADAIRDKLKEMHVVLLDTKDGVSWSIEK